MNSPLPRNNSDEATSSIALSLVKGKQRACRRCKDLKRPCSYVDSRTCVTCMARGVVCSGPVPGHGTERVSRQRKTNILPSSSRSKLDTATLSFALSFSLIEEYRGLTSTLTTDTAFKTHTFASVFEILSRTGNTTKSVQIQEIVGSMFMYIGSQTTTHSAVVGDSLSRQPASLKPRIVYQDDGTHLPNSLGTARCPAGLSLKERLLSQLDQFLVDNKIPSASELGTIVYALDWIDRGSPGDPHTREILNRILDIGASLAPIENKEMLEELRNIFLLDLRARWSVGQLTLHSGLSILSPSINTLPPLPSFSSEELDMLVDSERIPLLQQRPIVRRVINPRYHYVQTLQWRVARYFQNSAAIGPACRHCWSALRYLRERNIADIDSVLLHPNYDLTPSRGPLIVIVSFLQDEVETWDLLLGCYHFATGGEEGLVAEALEEIMAYLSRISYLWELIGGLNVPWNQGDLWSGFRQLSRTTTAMNAFDRSLMVRWVYRCPGDARSLLKPLKRATYFSVHAVLLVAEIESALNAAETLGRTAKTMVEHVIESLQSETKASQASYSFPVNTSGDEMAEGFVGATLTRMLKDFQGVGTLKSY